VRSPESAAFLPRRLPRLLQALYGSRRIREAKKDITSVAGCDGTFQRGVECPSIDLSLLE
jgi:hypothetical protein